jgi:hypothetical protein
VCQSIWKLTVTPGLETLAETPYQPSCTFIQNDTSTSITWLWYQLLVRLTHAIACNEKSSWFFRSWRVMAARVRDPKVSKHRGRVPISPSQVAQFQ